MKVKTLSLNNFTVFNEAEFEFSPGINVLIGANATGKSHVLKSIYAVAKTAERSFNGSVRIANGSSGARIEQSAAFSHSIRERFVDVFKPADAQVANLIRDPNSHDPGKGEAEIKVNSSAISFTACIKADQSFVAGHDPQETGQIPPCVFIPPREALALYEGFQFAYENRELSFDGTYNDLCLALSGSPLKGEKAAWAKTTIATLEGQLDGKVQLKNNRFYVGKFEAHLVAEGLRKVASIVQLLRNGSIGPDSVLLWDEPEGGLNPRLVKVVADLLLLLASKGVQIFVATHDYLLSSELSIVGEYQTPLGKSAKPRFFCLTRESLKSPVTVETGEALADLQHNPILDEFAAHYDREQRLFVGEGAAEK